MDTLITAHYMKTQTGSFEEARAALFKMGIKTSFDETRVIFSTEHIAKNQPNAYAQECNGLILERNTWKPLMVPPRSLRFHFDTDTVNKFLHQGLYHISYADDGTCFNMYFTDKWCISTAKGYEMNDIRWNNSTYLELIVECLTAIGMTWDEFTALLDKQYCYSFGFKHPKFHNFQQVHKIWFIQSVCLCADSHNYLWAQNNWNEARIPKQTMYNNHVSDIHELHRIAHNALRSYIDLRTEPCYGFILRSVNFEQTGINSDLFIESSLMTNIRRLCYDHKLMNACHTNGWNKEKAIALSAYLDSRSYEVFLHLFPQYKSHFDQYQELITHIVDDMIKITNKTKPEPKYATPATQLLTKFKLNVKYDIHSKSATQKRRVLTEYITNPEFMQILYLAL